MTFDVDLVRLDRWLNSFFRAGIDDRQAELERFAEAGQIPGWNARVHLILG